MDIKDSGDLLWFLVQQREKKLDWFSHTEQRLTGIQLAHQIAANHADKMEPAEVVDYVLKLNDQMYQRIIRKDRA